MSDLSEGQKSLMEKLKLRFDNLRNLGILGAVFYSSIVAFSKVSSEGTTDDIVKGSVGFVLLLFTMVVAYWYLEHTKLVFAPDADTEKSVYKRFWIIAKFIPYLFITMLLLALYVVAQY